MPFEHPEGKKAQDYQTAQNRENKSIVLRPKQRRFVEEYLVDVNATRAAIRAGYSCKTARSIGQRLLTNVDIQAAITEGGRRLAEKTQISAEQTLHELASIAFGKATDAADWGPDWMRLKDSSTLTPEAAAYIAAIHFAVTSRGYHVYIRFHDKVAALDKLMRYFGLYDPKYAALARLPDLSGASTEDLITIIQMLEGKI